MVDKSYNMIDCEFDGSEKLWSYSIEALNDSLLYIEDWLADYQDDFPLMSMEGYDSIDNMGNVVYE